MLNKQPEPTKEDLRIAASNERRAAVNHLGYVLAMRTEVHVTKEHITELRKQLAEAEAGLKSREARLKTAEQKLSTIDPELLKTVVIK